MYTPGKYYQKHKINIGDLFKTCEGISFVVIPGIIAKKICGELSGNEDNYIYGARIKRRMEENRLGEDVNGFAHMHLNNIISIQDQEVPKIYIENGFNYGDRVRIKFKPKNFGEEGVIVSRNVHMSCDGTNASSLASSNKVSCYCHDRHLVYYPVLPFDPKNVELFKTISNNDYPHLCRECNKPALDMAVTIYCSNAECKFYHP
jgi:hypothetical protein